jgi:hypothetical protein
MSTATYPPGTDLIRPKQALDLRQRPASTSMQLVHTEVVTVATLGRVPVAGDSREHRRHGRILHRRRTRDFCSWIQFADKPVRPHWRYPGGGAPGTVTARAATGTPNLVTGKPSPGRGYATATVPA